MTAPVLPRAEAIWEYCARIWAASLPGMSELDFDHEACRVACEPVSAGGRYMRDAIDTERERRRAVTS